MVAQHVHGTPATPVVFPPVAHGAKIVFGRNGSDYGGDLSERAELFVDRMKELGISLTRIGIHWGGIEPARGTPYDFAEEDRLVDFLVRRDVEPLVVLACAPRWAYDERPGDYEFFRDTLGMENLYTVVTPSEAYADDYARAIETIARRYRGRIRYYEFWNEPDGMAGPVLLRDRAGDLANVRFGGDPVRYTWWLRKTYEALKAGDPNALLAAGSLCAPTTDFLEAIYAAGGRGFFDAVSAHPYDADGVNAAWLDDLRQVMVRQGDAHLGIWITEYSWKTTGVTDEFMRAFRVETEGEKAVMLQDALLDIGQRPFVTMSILHTLNDWRDNDNDPATTQGFGLVDYEGNPKTTFAAFGNALRRETERVRAAELITGPSVGSPGLPAACVLQGPLARETRPRFRLPEGWTARRRDAIGENPVYHVLPATNAAVGRCYPVGVETEDGATVGLRYLEIQESVQIRPHSADRWMAAPGERTAATVALDNISPFTIQAQLMAESPEGWRVAPAGVVGLRPGAMETRTFTVEPVPGASPGWHSVRVWAEGPGICGARQDLRFGVAPPCPRLDDAADPGAWSIRARTADTEMLARVGWNESAILVEVEATDPLHRQGRDDVDLWREDSLQIGVDPRFDARRGALYQVDDYEYIVALRDDGAVRAVRYAGPGAVGPVDSVRAGVERDEAGGRTRYVVRIPWEELQPLEPEPGRWFGLSLLLNAFDGAARTTVEWGGGIAGPKAPWDFVGVRLDP